MIDVSVIIINYNTLKMTDECICSVIEKTSGISYEIILVDNASTDGSKEFFSNDNRVTYIYNDENLGFGRANNKGIEIAQGRNILFLNSDTLLRNNAIKILSDYLDENPKVGACGGNLYDAEGNPAFSFERTFPSIYNELNAFLGNLLNVILFGKNQFFNYSDKPLEVGYIIGADLMIKKIVLDRIGGFNERFFLYCEETELCLRIHRMNYRIYNIPTSKITHFEGRSSEQDEDGIYLRKENSWRIFCSLSYSKRYCVIINAIKKMTLYRKLVSPIPTTRIRWRHRKQLLMNSPFVE